MEEDDDDDDDDDVICVYGCLFQKVLTVINMYKYQGRNINYVLKMCRRIGALLCVCVCVCVCVAIQLVLVCATKACSFVKAYLLSFLSSALDIVGELSPVFRAIVSGTHLTRGWAAPRVNLDVSGKKLFIYVG